MSETPRVESFIMAKQDQVLARGIAALTSAGPDQVRPEVHRLLGTLGTYGLGEAVELLRPLDLQLKSHGEDPSVVESARAAALDGLLRLQDSRTGGES